MNYIWSPYLDFICSSMSVTGPHTCDWHSCGVENSSATAFLPTTSAKSAECMSLGGTRVSILDTSPLADSSVSVCTFGAFSPTPGIGSAATEDTSTWAVAPVSEPSGFLVVASTAYLPFLANLTLAP